MTPLLALLLLSLTGDWQVELQQGTQLLKQKQYAEARKHLELATQLNPKSSQAFFYLAMSTLHLNDRAAAEKALRQSIKLDPYALNSLFNLGVILLEDGQAREAATFLERARQSGPPSPELTIHLIRAYLESSQNDRASAVAAEGGRQFGSMLEFHMTAGKLLLTHGLAAESCEALARADYLEPRQPGVAIPTAAACLEANNLTAARSALEGVDGSARDSVEYRSLAGRLHTAAGEKEAALSDLNAAVTQKPSDPLMLLSLGRAYQKFGEQRKAVEVFEKATKLDPRMPEIPYNMAVSYIAAEDEPVALRLVSRALELDPHFDRAQFLLGSIHLAAARLDEAEPPLLQAAKARPQNVYYRCFVGMLRAAQNRDDEAEAEFREALRLNPSYALPHFQLGKVLARKGQTAEAITELQRAVELQQETPEAYYQLALLLRRTGQPEKAQEAMARFNKLKEASASERDEVIRQLQDTLR
jgi:Flp pilus assembly protein TadD